MKIEYSLHMEARIKLRNIPRDLPKTVYENSTERFRDTSTGHEIAVMEATLHGRTREVMVAYTSSGQDVTLLTIHPLKKGQKENRISAGRWEKA